MNNTGAAEQSAPPEESLSVQGKATDELWCMVDGPETHPVGVRFDCGDAGTVWLSKKQAVQLAADLNDLATRDWSGK